MATVIEATFDGTVFRPTEPVALKPNTIVRLTVEGNRRVTPEAFLDTSYAIALVSESDRHHTRADALADQIETDKTRLVTTRAVLLEIGNALAKQRVRGVAVRLLASLEADPNVTIVPLTDSLYARAFELYRNRPDKDWGMVDCISFVVMSELKLTEALTADEHFEQAGFVALLRRNPP
jgi:uncharacterized protein